MGDIGRAQKGFEPLGQFPTLLGQHIFDQARFLGKAPTQVYAQAFKLAVGPSVKFPRIMFTQQNRLSGVKLQIEQMIIHVCGQKTPRLHGFVPNGSAGKGRHMGDIGRGKAVAIARNQIPGGF